MGPTTARPQESIWAVVARSASAKPPSQDLIQAQSPQPAPQLTKAPRNATESHNFLHTGTDVLRPWAASPAAKEAVPAQTHFPADAVPHPAARIPPGLARTSLVCGTGCELGCHRCHQRSEPSPSGT